MKKKTLLFGLSIMFLSVLTIGCKDKKNDVSPDDKIKDSIFYHMQHVYLWQESLPSDFSPRMYATPQATLNQLKTYKLDPSTNKAIDKYSFIDDAGVVTSQIQEGKNSGKGLEVVFSEFDDLRTIFVYTNSEAGNKGIKRGWRIIAVDGDTNINYDNKAKIGDAIYGETSAMITFQKPDSTQETIKLNNTEYTINSVMKTTSITKGASSIGYLAFNTFLGTPAEQELDAAFASLTSSGINELIVDLRYNRGGAVTTAKYLANYLAPSSADAKTMIQVGYNIELTSYFNSDSYKNYYQSKTGSAYSDITLFKKKGSLNLKRIFFLVNNYTASASELLINALTPYTEINLIGVKTYGKPVGFFPITIMNQIDLYAVSSIYYNSEHKADYFSGMQVQYQMQDNTKDWGDESDKCIAGAIQYIETGGFPSVVPAKSMNRYPFSNPDNIIGMFEFPNKG